MSLQLQKLLLFFKGVMFYLNTSFTILWYQRDDRLIDPELIIDTSLFFNEHKFNWQLSC